MYTIQTLNAISPVIYNHLPQDSYTVAKETAAPDAIIVRSASMLDMELLCSPLRAQAQATITSLLTNAPKRASACSTHPAPTPTPSKS